MSKNRLTNSGPCCFLSLDNGYPRQAKSQVIDDPHKQSPLDHFHDDRHHHTQSSPKRQEHEHNERQDNQRLQITSKGDRVDQGLNRQRRRQTQDPDKDRENENGANVLDSGLRNATNRRIGDRGLDWPPV